MIKSNNKPNTAYIQPECQVNSIEVEQGLCVASNEDFGVQPLCMDFAGDPFDSFNK